MLWVNIAIYLYLNSLNVATNKVILDLHSTTYSLVPNKLYTCPWDSKSLIFNKVVYQKIPSEEVTTCKQSDTPYPMGGWVL